MSRKKLYALLAIAIVLYGVLIIYKIYNKPHKNISEQKADFHLKADGLMNEFMQNEVQANAKYLDKVIILEGKMVRHSVSNSGFTILVLKGNNSTVNCEMAASDSNPLEQKSEGDIVFIKGLFIGYDDLLEELQLKKCTLVTDDLNQ